MKTAPRLVFFALLFCLAACNSKQPAANTTTTPPAAEKTAANPAGAEVRGRIATDITNNFAKKDYAAVRKDFAQIMLDALSEEKLKNAWEDLTTKMGDFDSVVTTQEVELSGYRVIKKRCHFAKENATIQVTFNDENKVVGLYLRP